MSGLASLSADAQAGASEHTTVVDAFRMSYPTSVGEQLRALRIAVGLTQHELAARIGSTQPAVAHLEACKRVPTLATLEKLARALGRDLVVVVRCGEQTAIEVGA